MVRFEWVRSAEPPTVRSVARVDRAERHFRGLAGGDLGRLRRHAPCGRPRAPRTTASGSLPAIARFEGRRAAATPRAAAPRRGARPCRARRPRARPRRISSGHLEGRMRPADVFARRGDLGLAERRAMRLFRAAADWARPCRSTVRQAISDGRSERARRLDRLGDGFHVMAVDLAARASRRRRSAPAGPSTWRARSGRRWKSNCRPRSTIRRASFRWPARSIASWLMPSCRQPSPAIT